MDDHTSPSNLIQVLGRFTLGEVVVQVSKAADRIDTPYLMFRINRLCADAAVTAYGLAVQARLGGIELADKIHLGEPDFRDATFARFPTILFLSRIFRIFFQLNPPPIKRHQR